MTILEKITNLDGAPSEQEYLLLLDELLNYLSDNILPQFIRRTKPKDKIEYAANKELLTLKVKEITNTYVNVSQKWKSKLNFDKYLFKSLHNFIFNINTKNKDVSFKNKFICPGCKYFNLKTPLEIKNNNFYCQVCFENINNKQFSESRRLVCKIFANHSKSGGKCPSCLKWLPASHFNLNLSFCPYCDFEGPLQKLIPATHPQSLFMIPSFEEFDSNKTYDNSPALNCKNETFKSFNSDYGPEDQISLKEDLLNNFKILLNILNNQNSSLSNKSRDTTLIQKHLMYQAFYNMLYTYPAQMIDYLIYQKTTSGFNIQSKIFQEYCLLIENHLPVTIGKNIITNYCDPNLNLYLGISEFTSEIDENFNIKNKTDEVYIGGKKLINYGPCFIGRLISVTHQKSQSEITNLVDNYSFNNIKLLSSDKINVGDIVKVKHFRIASHYEMGPLVFLQRIRKDITTRTKKVIHGK
jgi:hypothetical protein